MNSIKLRIFDTKRRDYLHLLENNADLLYADNQWYILGGVPLNNNDFILEMCTGVKDQHGKDVYGGDIIKWWWDSEEDGYGPDSGCGGYQSVDHNFQVIFKNGSFGFEYDKFRILYGERFEVIGNARKSKKLKVFQKKLINKA